jgi:membrane protease YdiL (CAAX protease family)
MSDSSFESGTGISPSSTVALLKRLRSEAVFLGAILLASLVVAFLERNGAIPWAGYPSSLLLLALSLFYRWKSGVAVRIFSSRSHRRTLPLLLSMALPAMILIFAAFSPIKPWSRATPSPFQSLHLLILVPFSEELYFRGLLFDHLRRGFTSLQATLLCSLLFAALHSPVIASLSVSGLSLIACILVLKTGSLTCALQLHISWNALAVIHGISEPSSRWAVAVLASGLIVVAAMGRSKETRSISDGCAN